MKVSQLLKQPWLALLVIAPLAGGEIPKPVDAPQPLTPAEAAKSFRLPSGYAMKLLAAEPLIREPSGVCWDERGRLFVCELHGYNVEGQYDIDELNKKGELDTEVRRVQASEENKKKAEADNYGTVKMLTDTDGDGVMDKAEVWAERLPLCYGLVPARGGIIVACPPDIVYLADKDGDGKADVRETLFTGFGVGQPERGVNAPTWGVDNWIYFGRGHAGGTITGPHLAKPVIIGNTDFRIRADGSAIEAITGSTKTIGMAFTEGGDRFVTNTISPGYFVTPIPAAYFIRNTDAPAPLTDATAADYNKVYPLAPAHPWRLKREQHAEYFAFYKKISLSDAAATGYFTSACSPLVYQDPLMPALRGEYLVCEPAQNLVHHAVIQREGTRLRLQRPPEETKSEFLASTDPWFHPIGLQPTPDGSIAVIDFYREIIEDYSAIPRHLQQQYGVTHGNDRGRLWVLTKEGHAPRLTTSMAELDDAQLNTELSSDLEWRRLTARRLLIERQALKSGAAFKLPPAANAALAKLYAYEGCNGLTKDDLVEAWRHPSGEVRRQVLRIADRDFAGIGSLVEQALLSVDAVAVKDPAVALQAALSLGNSNSPKRFEALAQIARLQGDLQWLDSAIASSAAKHEGELLLALTTQTGKAQRVMEGLAAVLAARGDAKEIAAVLTQVEAVKVTGKVAELLKLGLEDTVPLKNLAAVPIPKAPSAEELKAMEARMPGFVAALQGKPNFAEGLLLFTGVCGSCHRSHGVGISVGPDLDAEFQRAPETILRDILFPHEALRPGYETVMAKTQRGETLAGIAVSDSPTSLTLRLPGGQERSVLRKRASISTLRNVSLMTPGLGEALKPQQLANIIAFLRQPGP